MRSMHAEMRALAASVDGGDPHANPGRYACEHSGDGEGIFDTSRTCPACMVWAHARAMRDPNAGITVLDDGVGPRRSTFREATNAVILRYGYPLPLVPEPRP